MSRKRINLAEVMERSAELVDGQGRGELSLGRVAEELGVQPSALYNGRAAR